MLTCCCALWCVAKERIVGFYSTGPKIKENDLQVSNAHIYDYISICIEREACMNVKRVGGGKRGSERGACKALDGGRKASGVA